jgi:hypothetical protein
MAPLPQMHPRCPTALKRAAYLPLPGAQAFHINSPDTALPHSLVPCGSFHGTCHLPQCHLALLT